MRQTRTRFPDKLADAKYGDMVARAAAEIDYHWAERLAYRANYREKRKEFRAAREYYNRLLEKHPNTPQADVARNRLQQIETLPDVPQQRLSWLNTVFRDTRRANPLELSAPSGEPSETKLR